VDHPDLADLSVAVSCTVLLIRLGHRSHALNLRSVESPTYNCFSHKYTSISPLQQKSFRLPRRQLATAVGPFSRNEVRTFCWEYTAECPPVSKPLTLPQVPYDALKQYCNLWRNWNDIQDSWDSLASILTHWAEASLSSKGFQEVAGPGAWNDPDMLIIGNEVGGQR
jgi:hypothetical protein